ncbi:hypothetical protein ACOSQ2_029250 [Xanthoceras sorbifolium]
MSQPLENMSLNPLRVSNIQKNVEHLKALYMGMLFETLEEARDYYENYGRWAINEVTSRQFVCAHQGKYGPKIKRHVAVEENDETETNEKDDTMKRVCKLYNEKTFNHKIVFRARRMKMKSKKYIPKAVKRLTETFERENSQIGKVCSILGGPNIGFDSKDYERATNFFWVDSQSLMAYHYFGDIVIFDTIYRTNKYNMPFVPITGVNHHLQSIQFGCALLQDETWLEAMGGHHPGAIAKVFPNTHHHLCLWHIKKKFIEKFSHVYFKKVLIHFFDGFITSTTNLKEFVFKYELALKKIMKKESNEDFESEHKYRIVNDGELLLKCAPQLYTRKTKYGEPEEFVVKLNLQNYKGMCECQNFEFIEILYRHFLKVFVHLDIDTIPDHFILTRWKQEDNKLSHMCHQATQLACAATSSNEAYTIYMETYDPGTQIHSSPSLLLDPNISQTKGMKKDNKNLGRLKSGIELALNKKKR